MTQIYLPYNDFERVAQVLDNKRLNKQLTEAKQVYTANKYGYGKQGNPHPYEMWCGYEDCLLWYIVCLYKEWQVRLINGKRGGKLLHKSGEFTLAEIVDNDIDLQNLEWPTWINDNEIFSSYRAALLYKDHSWYNQFDWQEEPAIPVKIDKNGNVTLPYVYGIGK